MSKHTPGPWTASQWHDSATDQGGWTISANGHLLPMSDMDSGDGDNPEANARLIAAAPELLEACVELLAAERFSVRPPETVMQAEAKLGRIRKAVAQAEAAIAKATGEQP